MIIFFEFNPYDDITVRQIRNRDGKMVRANFLKCLL